MSVESDLPLGISVRARATFDFAHGGKRSRCVEGLFYRVTADNRSAMCEALKDGRIEIVPSRIGGTFTLGA